MSAHNRRTLDVVSSEVASKGALHSNSGELAYDEGPDNWLSLHGDALFRFALLRVGNRETAEDLVQDALVSGLNNWSDFKNQASVRTWLTGILRNKIIDYYRSAERRNSTPTDPQELRENVDRHFNALGVWSSFPKNWGLSPDQSLQVKEFLNVLSGCIGKLPKASQRVFILRVVDGLSGEEVSKNLGLNPSNTGVLLYRARMALRDCVESNWLQLSSRKGEQAKEGE